MEQVALGFLLEKAWNLAIRWKGAVDDKKEEYLLLRQPIWRFRIEWAQYLHHSISSSKVAKPILEKNRNQILDILSHINHKTDSELYGLLLDVTDTLYKGVMVVEGQAVSNATEIGNEADKKAMETINWIDLKLKML